MEDLFAVDIRIDGKNLSDIDVCVYDEETLEYDLKYFSCRDASEITENSGHERIVFKTESDADNFILKYKSAFKLASKKIKIKNTGKRILTNVSHIALALMGYKLHTVRNHLIDIAVGDLFTYSVKNNDMGLVCCLTGIKKTKCGRYRYDFTVKNNHFAP